MRQMLQKVKVTESGDSNFLEGEQVDRLKFADENNFNPVSLGIAWVNSHDSVTCPIIGARNVEQLKPALESLAINMTQNLRHEISDFSLAPAIATDRAEEA